MTKCPDCRKRVSRRAVSCPSCGYPFRAQTTEQTSKTWKALSLICGGLLVLGGLAFKVELWLVAFPLLATGLLGGLMASFGAWWQNG